MVRYNLICVKEHEFEAWFPSSAAYDEQRGKGQVRCPECATRRVEKAVMAPNVATGRARKSAEQEKAAKQMRKALKTLRKQVEENGENVGKEFASEARKIHYGDAEDRNIYGNATVEEAKELTEEGIEIAAIPWIDAKEN
ncbi:MAG: DUF1178 family protein [Alphaproteobacteria bacterium]